MEKKLNIAGMLDFSDIDLTAPEEVVKKILVEISEETRGIVLGKIEPYSGHVMSYTKPGFSAIAAAMGTADREVDIQSDLGKIGQEEHKFECFLYTPAYEKYRFRVFFIKYDVANYPVNVILDESVARSAQGVGSGYVFTCDTRAQLEELVVKIFASKRMINVMQEFVRINQSKKAEKDSTGIDDSCEEVE